MRNRAVDTVVQALAVTETMAHLDVVAVAGRVRPTDADADAVSCYASP